MPLCAIASMFLKLCCIEAKCYGNHQTTARLVSALSCHAFMVSVSSFLVSTSFSSSVARFCFKVSMSAAAALMASALSCRMFARLSRKYLWKHASDHPCLLGLDCSSLQCDRWQHAHRAPLHLVKSPIQLTHARSACMLASCLAALAAQLIPALAAALCEWQHALAGQPARSMIHPHGYAWKCMAVHSG